MEQTKTTNLTANQLLTKGDLEQFQNNLLHKIKEIIASNSNTSKWLKSKEVCQMLNITHRTLQTLRNNNQITFSRIGRTMYYKLDDLEKIYNNNKKRTSKS